MKISNQELKQQISQQITSIAICWKITLNDTKVITATSCDKSLTIDQITYNPHIGFLQHSIISSLLPFYNVTTIEGICCKELFQKQEVISGKYTNAEVDIFVVNYNKLNQGIITIFSGYITNITLNDENFVAELKGHTEKFSNMIGEVFSPLCRAIFCDEKCKLDYNKYTEHSRVTDVVNKQVFQDTQLTQEKNYYQYGSVTFLSGNNINITKEIKYFENQVIHLVSQMPNKINIGDRYSIIVGCNKKFSTCNEKFNNSENFRGEPHIPDSNSFY